MKIVEKVDRFSEGITNDDDLFKTAEALERYMEAAQEHLGQIYAPYCWGDLAYPRLAIYTKYLHPRPQRFFLQTR